MSLIESWLCIEMSIACAILYKSKLHDSAFVILLQYKSLVTPGISKFSFMHSSNLQFICKVLNILNPLTTHVNYSKFNWKFSLTISALTFFKWIGLTQKTVEYINTKLVHNDPMQVPSLLCIVLMSTTIMVLTATITLFLLFSIQMV